MVHPTWLSRTAATLSLPPSLPPSLLRPTLARGLGTAEHWAMPTPSTAQGANPLWKLAVDSSGGAKAGAKKKKRLKTAEEKMDGILLDLVETTVTRHRRIKLMWLRCLGRVGYVLSFSRLGRARARAVAIAREAIAMLMPRVLREESDGDEWGYGGEGLLARIRRGPEIPSPSELVRKYQEEFPEKSMEELVRMAVNEVAMIVERRFDEPVPQLFEMIENYKVEHPEKSLEELVAMVDIEMARTVRECLAEEERAWENREAWIALREGKNLNRKPPIGEREIFAVSRQTGRIGGLKGKILHAVSKALDLNPSTLTSVDPGNTASLDGNAPMRARVREKVKGQAAGFSPPQIDTADRLAALSEGRHVAYRKAISRHEDVMAGIRRLWHKCLMLEKLDWAFLIDERRSDEELLSKEGYMRLCVAITLALTSGLTREEAEQDAEIDWECDSSGWDELPWELFRRSYYDLVDMWTETMDVVEYVNFMKKLEVMITRTDAAFDINVKTERKKILLDRRQAAARAVREAAEERAAMERRGDPEKKETMGPTDAQTKVAPEQKRMEEDEANRRKELALAAKEMKQERERDRQKRVEEEEANRRKELALAAEMEQARQEKLRKREEEEEEHRRHFALMSAEREERLRKEREARALMFQAGAQERARISAGRRGRVAAATAELGGHMHTIDFAGEIRSAVLANAAVDELRPSPEEIERRRQARLAFLENRRAADEHLQRTKERVRRGPTIPVRGGEEWTRRLSLGYRPDHVNVNGFRRFRTGIKLPKRRSSRAELQGLTPAHACDNYTRSGGFRFKTFLSGGFELNDRSFTPLCRSDVEEALEIAATLDFGPKDHPLARSRSTSPQCTRASPNTHGLGRRDSGLPSPRSGRGRPVFGGPPKLRPGTSVPKAPLLVSAEPPPPWEPPSGLSTDRALDLILDALQSTQVIAGPRRSSAKAFRAAPGGEVFRREMFRIARGPATAATASPNDPVVTGGTPPLAPSQTTPAFALPRSTAARRSSLR